jgi:arylsulfatase A-like enzyme
MSNRNVLIITFDCLRPDRLSGTGYRGVSTPTFDRVMDEGVTFTNAYCQAPNTWISHACLFTGCGPYRNGVRTPVSKISSQLKTMAELFQEAGYATFGLPAMSLLSREAGFARGFMEYRLDGLRSEELGGWVFPHKHHRTCADTLEVVKAWLQRTSKPFLGWIHYFGIHRLSSELLDLPDPYRRSYSEYAQFYDGKVVYADEQFLAPLIDHLQTLELLDQTVLVLWSDHGDDLKMIEHDVPPLGQGHNWGLTEDVMRTLLVIQAPWRLPKGQKRTDVCQSIDILPTLLEVTGLASGLNQCEGRSLISSSSQADPPVVYMENLHLGFVGLRYGRFKLVLAKPGTVQGRLARRFQLLKDTARKLLPYRWQRHARPLNRLRAWREAHRDPDKIIEKLLDSGHCELYDLVADPDGKNDIAIDKPQIVLKYKEILREISTRSVGYQVGYVTAEEEAMVEERLRSLGYF